MATKEGIFCKGFLIVARYNSGQQLLNVVGAGFQAPSDSSGPYRLSDCYPQSVRCTHARTHLLHNLIETAITNWYHKYDCNIIISSDSTWQVHPHSSNNTVLVYWLHLIHTYIHIHSQEWLTPTPVKRKSLKSYGRLHQHKQEPFSLGEHLQTTSVIVIVSHGMTLHTY